MQCIFQDSLFFYYSIFCKLCCFHAFFPPRIPGFPEFSLPEFLQRNPEFLRSEPGTYIFRRRDDRGRQSRADLHRLCQCPAIGQACRDARAECISRAGGILHLYLFGRTDPLLSICFRINSALTAHGHHHGRHIGHLQPLCQNIHHLLRRLLAVII